MLVEIKDEYKKELELQRHDISISEYVNNILESYLKENLRPAIRKRRTKENYFKKANRTYGLDKKVYVGYSDFADTLADCGIEISDSYAHFLCQKYNIKVVKGNNLGFTKREELYKPILDLYNDGYSASAIANYYNTTPMTIRKILLINGVYLDGNGERKKQIPTTYGKANRTMD